LGGLASQGNPNGLRGRKNGTEPGSFLHRSEIAGGEGICAKFVGTVGKRSPVLGYNHNFKHRGLIFHVQTEDSGVDNPHLFTHLFHGGVIISSRRMDYDDQSEVDTVKGLMQSQHKAVLKDLKTGTFDEKIDAYLGNNPDLEPSKVARSDSEPSLETLEKPPPEPGQPVADTNPSVPLRFQTEVEDPSARKEEEGGTDEVNTLAAQAVESSDLAAEAAAQRARELAEAAAAGAAKARELQEAATAAAARAAELEAQVRESTTTMATQAESAHSGAISLDGAAGKKRVRATPTAVDVLIADHDLGDPKVTFGSPPPPSSPIENIPEPLAAERSGTYSMTRAAAPSERVRRPPTRKEKTAPRGVSNTPAPARAAATRPGGKAANPEPGRPRSPVVVSRPAVIIGAPPKMVGKERERKPAASRKARASVFGKDLISEKSLDEVIMAYLSEDSSESE